MSEYRQELIDDAMEFVLKEGSDTETVRLMEGLLDICAQWVQGYDYPSSDSRFMICEFCGEIDLAEKFGDGWHSTDEGEYCCPKCAAERGGER